MENKIYAGYIVENPNSYDKHKYLFAVSFDKEKLNLALKIAVTNLLIKEHNNCDGIIWVISETNLLS